MRKNNARHSPEIHVGPYNPPAGLELIALYELLKLIGDTGMNTMQNEIDRAFAELALNEASIPPLSWDTSEDL